MGDISHAIQEVVEAAGLSVVRSLVGHGVGRNMHEDPQVPNYGRAGRGPLLEEGMVLAVEPMTTAGRPGVRIASDNWAIYTEDGSLAAHFEFTVAVTAEGPQGADPVAPSPGRSARASRWPESSPARAEEDPSPACPGCYHLGSCPSPRRGRRRRAHPRFGSGCRNGSQSRAAGTQAPKGIMKVRPSVKPMCEKCKIIRRHGVVLVICQNKRHKQRQG